MADISGLSERLRHLVSLDRPENGGPYQGYAAKDCVKAMEKAAAKLDALQARVKELEDECFRLAADTCHAGYGDEHGHHRCREVDRANARALRAEQRVKELEGYRGLYEASKGAVIRESDRALRAEQERDEAYERAANLCDEMGALEQSNFGLDRAAQNYFRARNAIRRLAGPEKEGK